MDKHKYTNRDLAQDYYKAVIQYSADPESYDIRRRKIAKWTVDLPAFYRKHGSLDTLQVKGIGRETKRVLELILQKGAEEAIRVVREEKIDKMRRKQFTWIPSKAPRRGEDYPPSWEDAVKRYEGD